MSKWVAHMPANLALIKYMGKTQEQGNIPCNSSLAYALDHCRSKVELTTREDETAEEPVVDDVFYQDVDDKDFRPSEDIPADQSIPFPTDI